VTTWLAPDLIALTSLHRNVAEEVVHAIKWTVQRARYMTLETIATMGDGPIISLPVVAR
jgi:hypothetical protein